MPPNTKKKKQAPVPSSRPLIGSNDPAAVPAGMYGTSVWKVKGETPSIIRYNLVEHIKALTVSDFSNPERVVDGLLKEALDVDVWTEAEVLEAEDELYRVRDALGDHDRDDAEVSEVITGVVDVFDVMAEALGFTFVPDPFSPVRWKEAADTTAKVLQGTLATIAPPHMDDYDRAEWQQGLIRAIGMGAEKEALALVDPVARAAAIGHALAAELDGDLLDRPIPDPAKKVKELLAGQKEEVAALRERINRIYLRVCGAEPDPFESIESLLQDIEQTLGETPEF